MIEQPLIETDIPGLKLFKRGKVRDTYDLGDKLLVITSDRISAFDVVMPNGIPGKGKNLTKMTEFWLNFIRGFLGFPHHLISTDMLDIPKEAQNYQPDLTGRVMLVKKLKVMPVESVVRGYISGSLWKAFVKGLADAEKDAFDKVSILGFDFPLDLQESQQLTEPIFTPSTKTEVRHDENIDFEQMVSVLDAWLSENGYPDLNPREIAKGLRDYSLQIYVAAATHAISKGIIIADTKFEFGLDETGVVTLADEVLTPDSSRFWPKDQYKPGGAQQSFDKQFLRDYLESIGWDKKPPAPKLPVDIIRKTAEKYEQALRLLTQ